MTSEGSHESVAPIPVTQNRFFNLYRNMQVFFKVNNRLEGQRVGCNAIRHNPKYLLNILPSNTAT